MTIQISRPFSIVFPKGFRRCSRIFSRTHPSQEMLSRSA